VNFVLCGFPKVNPLHNEEASNPNLVFGRNAILIDGSN
jgi:hypothetical protein